MGKTSRKKYTPVCVGLAGAIGIIKYRDGAGGAGCDLCAVYKEVLSSARGVFEES